ncbi:putative pentatricopeptide repeat-containing protein At3g15200 isoform X2 [Nymphaea colorata]|nr:putative pentatricopeptide repeat-containing protein At3g15200 isoform X2 [Nymphaea colorata]
MIVARKQFHGHCQVGSYMSRSFKDLLLKGIEKYMATIGLAAFSPSRECVHRGYTCRSFQVNHTKSNADDQMVNGSASPMNALNDQVRIASESRCSVLDSSKGLLSTTDSGPVTMIQDSMRAHENHTTRKESLDGLGLVLSEKLVLDVLQRHKSDWKAALFFFGWASNQESYSHSSSTYNEMLDILGRFKCFDVMWQLVDQMYSNSVQKPLINERTFAILIHRYSSDHNVEQAIETFYKREKYGLELDKLAFQTLLMSLCRYKHVEEAESLLYLKKEVFPIDIKSINIILNGWCKRGNLHEAKRVWNDIISSGCKPDIYTFGIYINCLTKAGKLHTAVKLFEAMWAKGCKPDVAICNCIIDALCFKKKVPEALNIFSEMNERGCMADVATYNSLIKHLCKIRRMEKAFELLDEMEENGCTPNARTYNYFLKTLKSPEDVHSVLKRMSRTGTVLSADTYNLILKMFLQWNETKKVQDTWVEMEKNGVGHDQRSYTVMVHGLYDKGKLAESYDYFTEMISKGMVPEPRTKYLVDAIQARRMRIDADSSTSMDTNNRHKWRGR